MAKKVGLSGKINWMSYAAALENIGDINEAK